MQSAAAAHVVLHVEAPHAYTPHDIVVTARQVPADIRMKMLVLHAPEKLGLKQEYVQEHQGH